ncbi:MAG TPA: hypothetical protein DCK87_03455 [Desulfotomaculum sp.]|nr:hypothetical protein [Desulfotomaculum sp.]
MSIAEELLNTLRQLNVNVGVKGDKLTINAPKGVITPALKNKLLANKKDLVDYLRSNSPKVKPQDPHKEFHALLLDTFREIDLYRFTDYPLAWAKKHGHTDISLAMFRAETNLNGAVLEKHLEEAKYWAGKLVKAYRELYEAKNTLGGEGDN